MSIGPAAPNNARPTRLSSEAAPRARAVASADAWAGVAPARRRAIARKITPTFAPPSPFTGGTLHAVQARVSRSGNSKSRGITPAIVNGLSSSCTTCPTTSVRPPNRSCQRPYDRMIRSGCPRAPSPVRNRLPSSGRAFRIEKRLGVMRLIGMRSGSPAPVRVDVCVSQPPTSSMVDGWSLHARKLPLKIVPWTRPVRPWRNSVTRTRRSASCHGSGLSSTP